MHTLSIRVGSGTQHTPSVRVRNWCVLTYLLLGESYPVRPVGGLKIHPGCVVVDPLLSVVAVSGHLIGLPLGKLVLSGSILCCSITFHFFHYSVCSGWLNCVLTSITLSPHGRVILVFLWAFLLKDSPFSAVFTVSGSLFQHSTDLTAN